MRAVICNRGVRLRRGKYWKFCKPNIIYYTYIARTLRGERDRCFDNFFFLFVGPFNFAASLVFWRGRLGVYTCNTINKPTCNHSVNTFRCFKKKKLKTFHKITT